MFKIGDIVGVVGGGFGVSGKIKELFPNETARVYFEIPNKSQERNICDKCGWPGNLSVNGGTGEIVCQRSGCGHGHGFQKRNKIFPLNQLINISEQRLNEKREDLKREIRELLERGVTNKAMTPTERAAILALI